MAVSRIAEYVFSLSLSQSRSLRFALQLLFLDLSGSKPAIKWLTSMRHRVTACKKDENHHIQFSSADVSLHVCYRRRRSYVQNSITCHALASERNTGDTSAKCDEETLECPTGIPTDQKLK